MKNRIREIKEQITELKSRMPAHSLQPRMLQELEDLETELDDLKAKVNIKIHKFNNHSDPSRLNQQHNTTLERMEGYDGPK